MTKITVTEEPAWKRILDIEVEPEAVAREWTRVVKTYQKNLNLPGFRKGKVPADMAEKAAGREIQNEVLRHLIPQALEEAFREKDLNTMGDPVIEDLKFEKGGPLSFKATVEVVPKVEISGYKGLEVTKEVQEVTPEMIQQTLDRLRESQAELEVVERPAARGDVVKIKIIELAGDDEQPMGEPQEMSLEVGGEQTPDTFTQALDGVKVGDMKKVPLDYPKDYQEEALAGTSRNFHMTVEEVQEKVWPEVDDAFAKKVLGDEEATAESLTERIRKDHGEEAKRRADRAVEGRILQRLEELNPFDLPQGVVQATLDNVIEDARKENPKMSEEEEKQLREGYQPVIERRFRTDVMLGAIARQEDIKVTQELVDAEIERFAQTEGRPAAQVKAQLSKGNGLSRLKEDIFKREVVKKLVEMAEVMETSEATGK